jgi:hypothetical protein
MGKVFVEETLKGLFRSVVCCMVSCDHRFIAILLLTNEPNEPTLLIESDQATTNRDQGSPGNALCRLELVGVGGSGDSPDELVYGQGPRSMYNPQKDSFREGRIFAAFLQDPVECPTIHMLDLGRKCLQCIPHVLSTVAINERFQLQCGMQEPMQQSASRLDSLQKPLTCHHSSL